MTNGIDRRDFLKGAAATVALLFTAEELMAQEATTAVTGPAVKFGVVGCGLWGKEILSTLSRLPSAQVTAICDTYEPFLNKGKEIAPNAVTFSDYKQLLASDAEAVVVATPSHQHKEIALAAIQAGKHVYCEAPLAASLDDAKAIALAGKGSAKVFQAGIQGRSNLMYQHVYKFVKAQFLGRKIAAVGQWNERNSRRRMAPTAEREKEINWRLYKATSPGLIGEFGIHQLDLASWYLDGLPISVTGNGSVVGWTENDDRDVPDTIGCIIEYPNNVRLSFTSTLASSFSKAYTLFQGTISSLMVRETRAWITKEADSPMQEYEVYAREEQVYDETGYVMIADSTKLLAAGKKPAEEGSVEPSKEALYCALENFTKSIREGAKVSCDAVQGYQTTAIALKANEAVISGGRIALPAELFAL